MHTPYKQQLLEALWSIMEGSEFLPRRIVASAEALSEEELERLLVICFQATQDEKTLSEEEKAVICASLQEFEEGYSHIVRRGLKVAADVWENRARENDIATLSCENVL